MRLINVTTGQLEAFMGRAPAYCILSHTWEAEEVTLQEFVSGTTEDVKRKAGYAKIQWACEQTQRYGLGYLWVDTCCIDKTSSAELSEAINSMFRWYQEADRCIAFLSDLAPAPDLAQARSPDPGVVCEALCRCRWFTRGWTLQELLAPSVLDFFDADHCFRWTRVAIHATLAGITHIDPVALGATHLDVEAWSVATRLSWARDRETTRPEDRAYCLLGLLGVHMPLLYGEGGTNAFERLQKEVLRRSSDTSLFGWSRHPRMWPVSDVLGQADWYAPLLPVLAPHPRDFAVGSDLLAGATEIAATNVGIRLAANDDVFVRPICLRGCSPPACCCAAQHRKYFLQIGTVRQHRAAAGILLERDARRHFHRVFAGVVTAPIATDFATDIWSMKTVGQDDADSITLVYGRPDKVPLRSVTRLVFPPHLSPTYMVGFPSHHWDYAHQVFVNRGHVLRRGCLDSWSLLTVFLVMRQEQLCAALAVGLNRFRRALFLCDRSRCLRDLRTLEREASTLLWEDTLAMLGSHAESAMLADPASRAPLSVSMQVSAFLPEGVRVPQMVRVSCQVKDCGEDDCLLFDAAPIEDTGRTHGMVTDALPHGVGSI